MQWQEIIPRLSGFSTPVFGVQWNPPEPERAVARRVLAFLEDRQVLYHLTRFEYPKPCYGSVDKIREKLSTEKGLLEPNSELAKHLGAIRSECRMFQQTCHQKSLLVEKLSDYPYPAKHWEFIDALSQLRKAVGFRIAAICVNFGLDIEESLESILPAESQAEEE